MNKSLIVLMISLSFAGSGLAAGVEMRGMTTDEAKTQPMDQGQPVDSSPAPAKNPHTMTTSERLEYDAQQAEKKAEADARAAEMKMKQEEAKMGDDMQQMRQDMDRERVRDQYGDHKF